MITIEFLRAGKAIFTVENAQGQHFTFRVKTGKDKYARPGSPDIFFVGLLTGRDNLKDYTCIGRLMDDNTFQISRAAAVTGFKKPGEIFAWALKMVLNQKDLPAGYAIRHAGHCCRCARTLTEPESLTTGIGPECRKKMGLAA